MNFPRRPVFGLLAGCAGLITLLGSSVSHGGESGNWPQFRGPAAMGVADQAGVPDHWGTNQNVAWKVAVAGKGWSSPVVWGNRVFLTTVTTDAHLETPKKGLYFGGDRKEIPQGTFHWIVLCLDLGTGRELWRREAHTGVALNSVHLKNSYASETPVTDGERVYASFGNVGLFCYDMEGKPLWSAHWPPVKMRNGWGSAASPIVYMGKLFVVHDNDDESFVTALDAATGKVLWKTERDEKSNWATPFIWKNDARTELVTPGTGRVRSYDLDGKLLWEFGGMSSIVIPTPAAKFGLLYVASGYVGDKVRPIFAIKPGASGDISLKAGESSNQFIAWSLPVGGPYNPSPLVYGDYFYVLLDFGFLSCLDARTGKILYDKERVRPDTATSFTASPWGSNGKIFALSEDGDTFVFQAGPEFKLFYKNSLDEMCMATPAIAGNRLLIRTLGNLYCIQALAGTQ